MLARGVLCRLVADVPKTSTHDLPRISQLLRTSLAAHNGAARPTVGAIARAFRATILEGRRTYATKTATQPTTRVKRDVKAVAKKPARKPAAKTTAAKKKAAPKKKTARKTTVKKAAPKRKPKKVLTPEEKEVQTIRELKKRALTPPKRPSVSAWTAFVKENNKSAKSLAEANALMKEAAAKYKQLSPAEREHYNHLAGQYNEAALAEYNKWIKQHTPEEIRVANRARNQLKVKLNAKGRSGTQFGRLIDDRQNADARRNPYIRFNIERNASGDLKGLSIAERAKLIGNEWKALSASEKKKYEDAYAAAKRTAA